MQRLEPQVCRAELKHRGSAGFAAILVFGAGMPHQDWGTVG